MNWAPKVEVRDDVVATSASHALHDLLDRSGEPPAVGEKVPMLWHWLAFLPQARQSELGEDGHPSTGTFLPPTEGRRRMHAGSDVTVSGTPGIGAPLRRRSRVTGMSHKAGRTGDLMFVTVDHRIDGDGFAITEQQTIVYLEPGSSRSERTVDPDMDSAVFWGRDVPVDPTLLFRFSALTYNAHRIHYDREYAIGTEGYPGLVVHGPLQAMLLADAVTSALPERTVAHFSFRALAPAFDDGPLHLRVIPSADSAVLQLHAYSNGVRTMAATAELIKLPASG